MRFVKVLDSVLLALVFDFPIGSYNRINGVSINSDKKRQQK